MMLLHTIPLFNNDLRCTHSRGSARQHMASKRMDDSQCISPATDSAETGTSAEAAWMGTHFFSPRLTKTVPPTASSLLEVEKIAWVGLRFLAVKTRQRQLLLVRSGLTERMSSSNSECDDDSQLATLAETHGGQRDANAVCVSFARVADFCTTTTATKRGNVGKESSPVSVMIVAGLQRVTGVVCCCSAAPAANPAQKLAQPQPSQVKEHTWNIGPFNHVASTSLTDSQVYICATSPSGNVEVYTWTVDSAGEDAAPVCVHQVLMALGHSFYGIAVTSAVVPEHETATPATQDISFWVMGGESAVTHTDRTVLGGDAEAETSTLPALRGLHGRVLQVESQTSQSSGKNQSSNGSHAAAPAFNSAPRTLNSLWAASSSGSPQTAEEAIQGATVSSATAPALAATPPTVFEAVSSLRMQEPCFLPSQRRGALQNGVDSAHPRPCCELTRRYALLVRASATRVIVTDRGSPAISASSPGCVNDEQKVSWSSAVLSLDNADSAAALDWLAEASSEAGTPPSFSIASVAPAHVMEAKRQASSTTIQQHMHSLNIFTPHRILQLSVSHQRDSTDDSIKQLRFEVQGTYDVNRPQRIIGIAPLFSPKAPAPLLLFYGLASRIVTNSDGSDEDTRSVYGQQTRKSTWAVVADVQASLLHELAPWSSSVKAEVTPKRSIDVQEHHCEAELFGKIQAIVQAEGTRLQRHLDERMNRLEAMLQRLLQD
nr:unnamed protein product [Leishmania braziliensis]